MVSCVSVTCVDFFHKDESIIWFIVFDVSSVAVVRNDIMRAQMKEDAT